MGTCSEKSMIDKHLKSKKTADEIQRELRRLESLSDIQQFNYNKFQDIKIQILPDDKLGPARFKQSKIEPNVWYAHPFTIYAMKKNILASGEDVDETVINYDCFKCNTHLDAQFWSYCPYCEAKIDL